MEKCAIFIDRGYFNKILKNNFNKADINYLKLCELISNELNLKRLRTYYYHSLLLVRENNSSDKEKHLNMQRFLSNIKRLPRFEVKLGKLQYINGQFRQKMVDVLMSLDIVNMCFNKQIEHVILIAGDSDFVPAIKRAKDNGAIVHLFYHPSSAHTELLDEIDEMHPISEDLINSCRKE